MAKVHVRVKDPERLESAKLLHGEVLRAIGTRYAYVSDSGFLVEVSEFYRLFGPAVGQLGFALFEQAYPKLSQSEQALIRRGEGGEVLRKLQEEILEKVSLMFREFAEQRALEVAGDDPRKADLVRSWGQALRNLARE